MAKTQQPQHRLPFAIIENRGKFYISKQCCYVDSSPEFLCANKKWKIISSPNPNNLRIKSTCGMVMEDDYQSLLKRILNKGYVAL